MTLVDKTFKFDPNTLSNKL